MSRCVLVIGAILATLGVFDYSLAQEDGGDWLNQLRSVQPVETADADSPVPSDGPRWRLARRLAAPREESRETEAPPAPLTAPESMEDAASDDEGKPRSFLQRLRDRRIVQLERQAERLRRLRDGQSQLEPGAGPPAPIEVPNVPDLEIDLGNPLVLQLNDASDGPPRPLRRMDAPPMPVFGDDAPSADFSPPPPIDLNFDVPLAP